MRRILGHYVDSAVYRDYPRVPSGHRIVDSNSVVLRALALRDGAQVLPHAIVPDRPEAIRAALADPAADVLLVSGGSSVGQEDHAPRLVAELGTLDFHGVAMRPSSPAGVGRIFHRPAPPEATEPHFPRSEPQASGEHQVRRKPVVILPGFPTSAIFTFHEFVAPVIRALGGLGAAAREGLVVKVLAVGSQGGLAAAARGECDAAPIHLLDPATGRYNEPFLGAGLREELSRMGFGPQEKSS